ncbi:hypothetical protein, partial [Aeromonas diversa]|uniref:hypothetical protein n=1 Tax=Aeromonas diversa TaxID=502790 RepID=UPI0005BAF96A
ETPSGGCETLSGGCETLYPIFSIYCYPNCMQFFRIFSEPVTLISYLFAIEIFTTHCANQGVNMPSSGGLMLVSQYMASNSLANTVLQTGNGGRIVVQA